MSAAPSSTPHTKTNLTPPQRELLPSFKNIYKTYRRSSDGNFTSPTQIILRVPQPPSPIMEVCQRATRSHSLRSNEDTSYLVRSLSSCRDDQSDGHQTGSGCSSPTSTLSRRSSIDSCSELVAALEVLSIELQQVEREAANKTADQNANSELESQPQTDLPQDKVETKEEAINDEKKNTRSLDLAEKEKLLTETRKQIQNLSHSKQQLERKVEELQRELDLTAPFRLANKMSSAKRWPKLRTNVKDLKNKETYDDAYVESSEIINAFLESERHYLNGLAVLHSHYELPLRMLSLLKPDVLSMQQLNSLFLNCSELVLLHRSLYDELSHLPSLPESVQVDKLLEILEKTFGSFSLYNSFLDNTRPQTIQRELKQLGQKQQFTQLLDHCIEHCGGVKLSELLQLPTERMTQYSELLTHFLDPHVRGLPEDGSKRAEALIRFLRNLRYDLLDDKSDWDHTLEKIKLLHKLTPDGPIPLEVFDSDVYLLKQGPLNQVVGSKEIPRFCFLFNKFIAIGEKASDAQFRIIENGMIPLSGAQLHKCVDVEGQAIGSDLQSGLKEDRLAFRLNLHNDSLFLRAAKPNVLKSWTEALEKSIHECQVSQDIPEPEHSGSLYPDVGAKIAAASLEKLFQQLTSPQMFRDDFMEVFLMTHSCFTTPKDVLTALLNCVKSPEDTWSDSSSQGSASAAFPFNMDELANDSDGGSNSPAPSPASYHRSSSSPASVTHRSRLNPSAGNNRNSVHSGTSFLSTSDSDTSPHTSAIVVDHPPSADGHTQDGWLEPEMSLKGVKLISRAPAPIDDLPEIDENCHYTKLLPRARVRLQCDESGDESDVGCEEDGGITPRQSSLTGSIELGSGHAPRSSRQRSLTVGDLEEDVDGVIQDQLTQIDHSSKMARELEDASKMMADMIGSLNLDFNADRRDSKTSKNALESNLDSTVRIRERTGSNRANRKAVVSLSNSEPDLTVIPPPLPPRDMTTPMKLPRQDSLSGMVRTNSEHSLFTQSVNISRSVPSSPFHVTRASSSISSSPNKKKAHTMDRSSPRPKPKKNSKKSGSMGDHYCKNSKGVTPSISVTSSLSAFGTQSPEAGKSPKRSKWGDLRNRMNIVKKFKRSPSLEPDELKGLQDRFARKGSLMSDALMSTGVNMTDGGVPMTTRPRRASTSGNSVALVSKIFAVLSCWQEEFFEDFENDTELKHTLCDFLHTLAVRTGSGTVECQGASQLLEFMEQKSFQDMAMPTTNSFPSLLSKTINIDPDVLAMYDWDHPDKLMPEKSIDLSKIHPKDSHFLKVMAEQLTLMEFAVYAAVQRRELLNCNWKKPNKDKLAPNVCRLIRRTNEMTSWVSTEILSRETPAQRATVIENFVKIATYCYQHNDMHCALNITIALGSACIKCLRHTWEEVDKRYKHKFERLKDWTDYHGRCKKMRERLERITADSLQKNNQLPVALPYIGAYLDQVYTLEMSSKTYNPNGLVNFAKMTKLASIVRTALQYQAEKFSFEPRLDVMVYVTAAKRLSENDLFELSMTREPSSH